MNWIDVAGYTGPDRRRDLETRKRLDAMSREELLQLLLTDPLTGCLSARAFEEAERFNPARCYCVWDVDSLKWLNDTYGHEAGDALLQAFARAAFEEGLLLYRTGGDEFVLRVETDWSRNETWRRLVGLQARFRHAVFAWRDERGELHAATGAGASFGFAAERAEAEAHLRRMKALRTMAGSRAERGERPRTLRVLSEAATVAHLLGATCEAA
jgi:diguanylate cyclase (GGDEF)-like protein